VHEGNTGLHCWLPAGKSLVAAQVALRSQRLLKK
jgi:hypothetical protein